MILRKFIHDKLNDLVEKIVSDWEYFRQHPYKYETNWVKKKKDYITIYELLIPWLSIRFSYFSERERNEDFDNLVFELQKEERRFNKEDYLAKKEPNEKAAG